MKSIWKAIIIFLMGGFFYYAIEMFWRGYSHWTMFILGGICYVFASYQNEFYKFQLPLLWQVVLCDAFALFAEFVTGCIVNLWLGWQVWDYSDLRFNILGQTSLKFALLFLPLCLGAIVLDDYFRYSFFHEKKPSYHWI